LYYDFGDSIYYHTYELADGTWAIPLNLENLSYSDETFVIFFPNQSKEESEFSFFYDVDGGLFKKTYHDQQWANSETVFSKQDVLDYLNFTSAEELQGFTILSCFPMNDSSYYVCWTFSEIVPKNRIHISQVFTNGTVQSQVLQGSWVPRLQRPLNFVYMNDLLMVYSNDYFFRSIQQPNGTWSPWHLSGVAEGFANLYPTDWARLENLHLIFNQYLVGALFTGNIPLYWGIADLTALNVTVHPIEFPHPLNPRENTNRAAIKLIEKNSDTPTFLIALITNSSIELWTYSLINNTWSLISQLDHTSVKTGNRWGEADVFNIDLLTNETTWRVFWNQQIKGGSRLHEIFTVSYYPEKNKWSPIIQVTYTSTITDDYKGHSTPTFSFLMNFIALSIIIVLARSNRKMKTSE
jgi:hypothetical protein